MVRTQHCAGRLLTQPEGQAAEKCLAGATGHCVCWAQMSPCLEGLLVTRVKGTGNGSGSDCNCSILKKKKKRYDTHM